MHDAASVVDASRGTATAAHHCDSIAGAGPEPKQRQSAERQRQGGRRSQIKANLPARHSAFLLLSDPLLPSAGQEPGGGALSDHASPVACAGPQPLLKRCEPNAPLWGEDNRHFGSLRPGSLRRHMRSAAPSSPQIFICAPTALRRCPLGSVLADEQPPSFVVR